MSLDAYRSAEDVPCPKCFGLPVIIESHVWYGVPYRIENRCPLCRELGRVPRTVSQQFWLAARPTA